jgi:hypothetical protein
VNEKTDWHKWYEDAYSDSLKSLDQGSKHMLDGAFFAAGAYAKRAAKTDGFLPRPGPDGEPVFTIQQGLRAACNAREDVAAVLAVQLHIVRWLSILIAVGVACLAVLIYIATHLPS